MNLYVISQQANNGWDTYDSAVVAATSPRDARKIHPGNSRAEWDPRGENEEWVVGYSTWAREPDQVEVELLGTAKRGTKRGVIVASFNAG